MRIVPESAGQRFKLPSDCRDAIAASAVLLRGWDYPHVPIRNDEFHCQAPVQDGWEGMVDWDRHRELWRLTRSGQFIHYLTLWEDLAPEFSHERVLSVSNAVFTLLEMLEFTRRLTGRAAYGTFVELEIDLVDVKDRELRMLDPVRMLSGDYTTAESGLELRKTVPLPLAQSDARSAARDLAIELFEMFQLELSLHIIDDIQGELVERR